MRKVKAADRRARRKELLKLVALEGMDDRLPAQLSGGQQQRIAVARALAHRPQVLLMDEPFGALDAKIREELRRTIRQIQRELHITTILVTHDQEEAFALADRIGVMHQGRLLECGKPDDLYTRPATRFVSTFLGAANLLLGYRTSRGVRFNSNGAGRWTSRHAKSSPCCVRRKWSCAPTNNRCDPTSSGTARSRKSCLPVPSNGCACAWRVTAPCRWRPARDGATERGSLLEVSRTLPEQRDFPVAPGQRIAVGARNIHVLPTPISSFTAVAATEAAAQRTLRLAAAGDARPAHADARHAARIGRGECAPPGMPVVATGPGSAEAALWQLRHGAVQLLCVPPAAPLPSHVLIHTLDGASRRATLAVAASLLRHVPAEAIYLGIQPAESSERANAPCACATCSMRAPWRWPTTASTCAPSCGPATVATELQSELAAAPAQPAGARHVERRCHAVGLAGQAAGRTPRNARS